MPNISISNGQRFTKQTEIINTMTVLCRQQLHSWIQLPRVCWHHQEDTVQPVSALHPRLITLDGGAPPIGGVTHGMPVLTTFSFCNKLQCFPFYLTSDAPDPLFDVTSFQFGSSLFNHNHIEAFSTASWTSLINFLASAWVKPKGLLIRC